MNKTPEFKLEEKQLEAKKLAAGPAKHVLFTGGGRAGKSFVICYIILLRALLVPESKHGIFRDTLKSCRQTLFEGTMKDVIKKTHPELLKPDPNDASKTVAHFNKSDGTITLPNGSVMMFFGLDSEERMDGILGHEFLTIWANECSKIDYGQITKLKSRLAQKKTTADGKVARTKFFYDQNPTTTRHWSFKLWVEHTHPTSGLPLEDADNYAYLKMTPYDNLANIAEDYVSEQKGDRINAKRFVDGDWLAEVDGALFNLDDIKRSDPKTFDHHQLQRIVVAVDPAASSKEGSDETGIIVAGLHEDGRAFVLEDASGVMTPDQWATRAADMYEKWDADVIVAERNNGGEMVENTIKSAGAHLPVKTVWASKGKVIRAEPISTLYANGGVHHVGEFEKLEAQMEVFTIDFKRTSGSPDRLDALVWGLWELTQTRKQRPSTMVVAKVGGFY